MLIFRFLSLCLSFLSFSLSLSFSICSLSFSLCLFLFSIFISHPPLPPLPLPLFLSFSPLLPPSHPFLSILSSHLSPPFLFLSLCLRVHSHICCCLSLYVSHSSVYLNFFFLFFHCFPQVQPPSQLYFSQYDQHLFLWFLCVVSVILIFLAHPCVPIFQVLFNIHIFSCQCEQFQIVPMFLYGAIKKKKTSFIKSVGRFQMFIYSVFRF